MALLLPARLFLPRSHTLHFDPGLLLPLLLPPFSKRLGSISRIRIFSERARMLPAARTGVGGGGVLVRFTTKGNLSPRKQQNRALTANEAAVALRPFYFAVHPDRFARHPDARQQNEKSLQIFNGYLNDLYPSSSVMHTLGSSAKAVDVCFSILDTEKKTLESVQIPLRSRDPIDLVRTALERCRLSTKNLPQRPNPSDNIINGRFSHGPMSSRFSTSNMTATEAAFVAARRRAGWRPRHAQRNDLAAALKEHGEKARETLKDAEKAHAGLCDDVNDLRWRTGAKDVIWQSEWAQQHMRRALRTLHRLLDQADAELRTRLLHALHKSIIRFGRGSSKVCCDGSLLFAVDNVPEEWQKICMEAGVRRAQLPQLTEQVRELRALFGDARIITPPHFGLDQTIHQLHTLSVRIATREPNIRADIARLAADTMIEVVTSYDELLVASDGRLNVPCNVDVLALRSFLQENAEESRRRRGEQRKKTAELESAASRCKSALGLNGLDWEPVIGSDALLDAIDRLQKLPDEVRRSLAGLALHFSLNPVIFVRHNGAVSLPLDWV